MPPKRPRRPKKFRFHFVASWLAAHYQPCKLADVGGGKGLLSYLLNQHGWDCTVIDPLWQQLPWKYKDLYKKRFKVADRESVKRITSKFMPDMVEQFDMVVGLHLHGANMEIVKACAKYGKDFLLIPCCVIDEPITKEYGINWRESLVAYGTQLGHQVKRVKFNFMGKNIAIYTDKNLLKIENPIFDKELLQEL